jgi:hypothetical protein
VKAEATQETISKKPKKKVKNLKDLIRPKKTKKINPKLTNIVAPLQVPQQTPHPDPMQNNFEQPMEQNPFPYMNYNSSLFNRRRHNFGYDFE